MNRFRSESGQAAVLSVVFMAALLGAMAMVLDVPSVIFLMGTDQLKSNSPRSE